MAYTFPVEVYSRIEEVVGKETALTPAKSVEAASNGIQEEAIRLAQQKKLEVREELLKELASKADLAALRNEMLGEIKALQNEMLGEFKAVYTEIKASEARTDAKLERLDRKFSILMILILVSVYITNQNTIVFILKLFGLMK